MLAIAFPPKPFAVLYNGNAELHGAPLSGLSRDRRAGAPLPNPGLGSTPAPAIAAEESSAMHLNHHRTGTGEPLVLIHGIGHHWQGWQPIIDRLAGERELVAIDLPGFGRSPMPPPGTPAGAEPLTELVSGFLAEIGLARPHVAGNSLGGWIALSLARRGLVRSAAALSPGGFQTPLEGRFSRASLALSRRTSRMIAGRAERLLRRPRLRKIAFGQVVEHPERIPDEEVGASVRALAFAPWFSPTLKAITTGPQFTGGEQITVPTTIAWGEHDRLLLPRQARRAARQIPSARMLTLEGCGHVPFYDDPDQVARVLLAASA
jgi:pimeloyl-ACP methyl ester carboxylesterase